MASLPQNIIPPEGWTTDPSELDSGYVWGNRNSPGQRMAIEYGLDAPRPIMCSAADTGEGCVMFQSGNKFYIWNQMDDGVWEITISQDINKILEKMYKTDTEGLKLKHCPGAGADTAGGSDAGGDDGGENTENSH